MDVVDTHAFDVIARDRYLVNELSLIDREDRDCGVGKIGGGAAVADVVEAIGSVVEAGVGRVAFSGGGAVNQLDAIEGDESQLRRRG
jgi:hypothetical protein